MYQSLDDSLRLKLKWAWSCIDVHVFSSLLPRAWWFESTRTIVSLAVENGFTLVKESPDKPSSINVCVCFYVCLCVLLVQLWALTGRCFLYGPNSFWPVSLSCCEQTWAKQTVETEECGTDVNWSKMCNWIPPFSVNTKSITDVGISPNNHICPVTYIDNQQCCCNICFRSPVWIILSVDLR